MPLAQVTERMTSCSADKKRTIRCSYCKQSGHNIRKCEQRTNDESTRRKIAVCTLELWWKRMILVQRKRRFHTIPVSTLRCPAGQLMVADQNPSKTRKQTIPRTVRIDVWCKYFGDPSEKCFVCRNKNISPFNFHAGHVIAEVNGGSLEVDNLRPICSSCNSSMGTKNLTGFMMKHYPKNCQSKLYDNRCPRCKEYRLERNHLSHKQSNRCRICLTRINLNRCRYCEKNNLSASFLFHNKGSCESCGGNLLSPLSN